LKAYIQKWGNSLALRIPKVFATEAQLQQDALVEISLVEGKLVIEPIREQTEFLDSLLAGITEQNLHCEIETGAPVGNEVW
jgi:antitoxin MazE